MTKKIEDIFLGYQRWVLRSKKLDFLQRCLRDTINDGSNFESLILNCLIALENNCLEDDKDLKIYSGKFVHKENDPFWILTRGIVNLEIGQANFDLKKCMIARDLIQKSLDMSYPNKPVYILYFLGRVHYEIGKILTGDDNFNKLYFLGIDNYEIDKILTSDDNFNKAKEIFEKILKKGDETRDTVVIINVLGNIAMKLGDRSLAQKYFEKAIELAPEFAYPYNGLGSLHRELREYEKAILFYSTALQLDKDFMYPWNYLGDCFRFIEEYTIALKCYKKAIEIVKDKSIIFPLYGLGRVYYELGNKNDFSKKYYDKANEYYNIVLQQCKSARTPQFFKYTKRDMAKIQEKLGNYAEAIELYKEAQGLFSGNTFRVEETKKAILKNEYRNGIKNLCNDFEKNCVITDYDKIDPAYYVMCQTVNFGLEKRSYLMQRSFEREFLEEKLKLDSFLTQFVNDNQGNQNIKPLIDYIKEARKNNTNVFLHVLRKWNSYTPIINNSRGGGYYLRVNDIGIVIDPGFNFIKNFKEANYLFSDIDKIFVTHAHDDHTADLESIFNLQYRYNKRLKHVILPREIAKEFDESTETVLNKYQSMIDNRYLKRQKRLELYITEGVYAKYRGYFEEARGFRRLQLQNGLFNYDEVQPGDYVLLTTINDEDNIAIDNNIKIKPIKAYHQDLIKKYPCVGFVVELEKVVVVYTGDTGWYNGTDDCLEQQYLEIKKKYKEQFKKSIVLIAHLGGFKKNEDSFWKYDERTKKIANKKTSHFKDNNIKNIFYDNHLGRLGLVKLAETLEPDICLISEFGEEFNGLRIKFTKILQEAFKSKKITFLPADIGLCLDFSNKSQIQVKAITDIDFKNHKITYKSVLPEEVKVGEFRDKNALFYFHGNNIMEGDCIQAFIEDFIEDSDSDLVPY